MRENIHRRDCCRVEKTSKTGFRVGLAIIADTLIVALPCAAQQFTNDDNRSLQLPTAPVYRPTQKSGTISTAARFWPVTWQLGKKVVFQINFSIPVGDAGTTRKLPGWQPAADLQYTV